MGQENEEGRNKKGERINQERTKDMTYLPNTYVDLCFLNTYLANLKRKRQHLVIFKYRKVRFGKILQPLNGNLDSEHRLHLESVLRVFSLSSGYGFPFHI